MNMQGIMCPQCTFVILLLLFCRNYVSDTENLTIHSRKIMRMIILVSILWLICQVYGQGYSYPYNPILYEAFQEALISDVGNLIQLQSVLYPPGGASPVSISVYIDNCDFTVNNISKMDLDDTSPYTNCSSVRCDNHYGYCSRQYLQYTISKDASSSSHDRLKQHISQQSMALILIDYISVYFFNKVTFSNLLSDDQAFSIDSGSVSLTLHVSELPTMPDTFEVDATLSLLLSWVSIYQNWIHLYEYSFELLVNFVTQNLIALL